MWTKHERIARDLRDAIKRGDIPAGQPLPAIPELMATYGVARETVRSAISALANEGLVTPQPGKGTIVRDTGTVNLHSRPTSAHPIWNLTAGDDSRTVTVAASWTTADPEITELLGLPQPGEQVVHRLRHYYKGHHVVLIHNQWVAGDVARAIKEATAYDPGDAKADQPTDLYSLMRQAHRVPAETTETVTTRMPDPEERDIMSMAPGIPVLVTLRITNDKDGAALETSSFIACGDRASQTYTVPIEPPSN